MRFELLIEDCSCLFCYILSFKVLNNINEIKISLFLKRQSVLEWEFIVKDIIAIIKWIVNESNLNCKYTNNINAKKMFYY